MASRRVLAAIGDANDPATWGGSPWHLLGAARSTGFLSEGLLLRPERLRRRRILWNARALLAMGRWGGYQYSVGFLDALLAQVEPLGDVEVISLFPLFPPPRWHGQVSFYIDATLTQNFEEYGLSRRLPGKVMEDALRRERDAYRRADRIVCMSRWAAESVRAVYRIPASKVHVVRAGANLDERVLSKLPPPLLPQRDMLRLGFVGKDWRRKGLPLLLAAAEQIEASGQPVRVMVIGPKAHELPVHRLIEPLGFLDKRRELPRFVAAVRGAHFGCLLSRAEALGISSLEFLRLGVPVVGMDVGGIPDCVSPEVGCLVPASADARTVAEAILRLWDRATYARLCEAAQAAASTVTWTVAVGKLQAIWSAA